METTTAPEYVNVYQNALKEARYSFSQLDAIQDIWVNNPSPAFIHLFMICWSSGSSAFAQPIEEILARAGIKCREKGQNKMADFFSHHSHEEEGHDAWGIQDTHALVESWNALYPHQLNAEEILSKRYSPAVYRYHQLHEDVVEGDAPWDELAIDLEIELLTNEYGPTLIKKCIAAMGQEVMSQISFLRDHVIFDEHHTDENFKVMHELIQENPQFTPSLIKTGERALQAYGDFLHDVLVYTKELYALTQNAQVAEEV